MTSYQLGSLTRLIDQGGWGPNEINTSVGEAAAGDGSQMRMNGNVYSHGIGTHAASVMSFNLQDKCSTFQSWVGIDDEVGPTNGSVDFQVFADGLQIFDSGLMTGADGAMFTGQLSISGVTELMLIVDLVGEEGDYFSDHANWAEPVVFCSSRPNGNENAVKHIRGSWGPVLQWPVKAIHASLLPSGHIVSHASVNHGSIAGNDPNAAHDYTSIDLAKIQDWSHQWIDHQREEMYCSAHTLLPDGSLFEFGGHGGANQDYLFYGQKQASTFDFGSKTWINQADMSQARWYATGVTLGNGHVLAIGGSHAGGNSFTPEVFDGTNWRSLSNVNYQNRLNNNDFVFDHTYPFVHLLSDGRVLWAGWDENMAYINVNGNGSWSQNYKRENIQRAWGASVVYRVDKILMVGGVDHKGVYGTATRSASHIDLTGSTPQVTKASPMLFPRADADGTILANGEVFMNGGGYYHVLGSSPTHVYVPETWNPDTGEWTLGAQATNSRGYHSTTLLLPDGRVWTGGGECGDTCPDGKTAQVYTPPYLYKRNGSGGLARRPSINSVKSPIGYGETFQARVSGGNISSGGVSKVSLIRLGSTTHHINFEQRYIELDHQLSGSNSLTLTSPANGNIAPPGFYMLFVIDGAGVPSVSKMVQIVAGNPGPTPTQPVSNPTPPPVQAPTQVSTPCNMLVNPSFENQLADWSGGGDLLVVNDDASSGNNALRITGGWGGQMVSALAGRRYVFSGVYKLSGATSWTGVGINFLNGAGSQIHQASMQLTTSSNYKSFSFDGIAPADTKNIYVWLYVGGSDEVVIDDLNLQDSACVTNSPVGSPPVGSPTRPPTTPPVISPTRPPTAPPTNAPVVCNTLLNGDFEAGLSGWSDYGSIALSSDTTQGSSAVSIASGWTGQIVSASANKSYTMSGIYKTYGTGGWTGLGIDFLNSSGAEISDKHLVLSNTGSYTPFTLSGTTPSGTTQIQVWIYREGSNVMLMDSLDLRQTQCTGNE